MSPSIRRETISVSLKWRAAWDNNDEASSGTSIIWPKSGDVMGEFLTSPDARVLMPDLLPETVPQFDTELIPDPMPGRVDARSCSGAGADLQYRLIKRCSICRFPQAAPSRKPIRQALRPSIHPWIRCSHR